LETKRNGLTQSAPTGLSAPAARLQRFLCKTCRHSFTFGRRNSAPRAQFSDDTKLEAVRLYVDAKASYRELARQLTRRLPRPVSKSTLNRWVDQVGGAVLTPLQMSARLDARWSGRLGVDGKAIFVRRTERCLLVGVDQGTQDVIHAAVVAAETEAVFRRFLAEIVTVAGYPLQALVMDAAPGFVAGWVNGFARLPLQLCRVHFDRHLDWEIPKHHGRPDETRRAELKARVRQVLYAPTAPDARRLMYALLDDAYRYGDLGRYDAVAALHRRFGLYTTHHHIAGLPADNNITENVVKQLGKKLTLIEGFATEDSAERFIKLLVAAYRHKRFTSSRNGSNGQSPLELAGITTPTDWLTAVLR
jgi:transposase-like protein